MKPTLSQNVASTVFGSAGLAYISLTCRYVRTGLVLYLFCMWASHKGGWFQRVREWPLFSKITLACGPPLVALGWIFSTIRPSYGMMMPVLLYAALSMIGGLQLRRLDSSS